MELRELIYFEQMVLKTHLSMRQICDRMEWKIKLGEEIKRLMWSDRPLVLIRHHYLGIIN